MRGPILVCLALLVGCKGKDERSTLDIVLERGELVVGTEPEFPPFESKNEKGEFVGFDMDMARDLAKDLGVKLRIEEMAWDSLPTALETGKIDVVISGMTATEERAKSRAFSEPYFKTRLCLLVNVSSGIEKPADANGKRLVVKLGTTGDIQSRKLFPDAKVVKLDAEGACALEVATGRADAFLYDRHSIIRHQKSHPDTTRAILQPLSEEPYAMAARLGDTKFVERLNRFLHDFRADGRYARIYEKHLGEPPDDK
ncbi:MAG TPA: transporter substrate-binding domain-containing protein [Planctomycetota bacterium]|nr:transporter substrate-binding domain-containing protein [Planctomycetota bacterium]